MVKYISRICNRNAHTYYQDRQTDNKILEGPRRVERLTMVIICKGEGG